MLIKLENIKKYFNNKIILDNINLQIDEKEITLLTGPNGSGKSTLLRIILGLVAQDFGSIHMRNGLQIGFSSASEYDFFPNLNMRDNMKFFASLYKAKQYHTILDELYNDFKIESFISTPFQELSTGTKKKFSIIRALITKPHLILLDEVLGPLDQKYRSWLIDYIKSWNNRYNSSCIITTHNTQDDYLHDLRQYSLPSTL